MGRTRSKRESASGATLFGRKERQMRVAPRAEAVDPERLLPQTTHPPKAAFHLTRRRASAANIATSAIMFR